jgi:NADH-quinone oxidoreductase subunit C
MQLETLIEALNDACPGQTFAAQALPLDETILTVPSDCLRRAIAVLTDDFDVHHLSTITGQATEEGIELLYHFWQGRGLTMRVSLPGDAPVIESVVDQIPGAGFYEREVAEMLGVTFQGHPDPQPLLLPEDWDEGPPLR